MYIHIILTLVLWIFSHYISAEIVCLNKPCDSPGLTNASAPNPSLKRTLLANPPPPNRVVKAKKINKKRPTTANITFVNANLKFRELVNSEEIVLEQGFLPGLHGEIAKKYDSLHLYLQGKLLKGKQDYQGITSNKLPLNTNTEQLLGELWLGLRFPTLKNSISNNQYFGFSLGRRAWDRDILGTNNVASLFEAQRWWVIESQWQWRQQINERTNLTFQLAADYYFDGSVAVDFGNTWDSISLGLGSVWGFRSEVVWQQQFSNRWYWIGRLNYLKLDTDRTSERSIKENGQIIESSFVFFPDTETRQWSFGIGLGYLFF